MKPLLTVSAALLILAAAPLARAAEPAEAPEPPAAPAPAAAPEAAPAAEPAAEAPAAEAPAAAAPAEAGEGVLTTATVKAVTGTAKTRASVDEEWADLKVGATLTEGADIITGFRSSCILDTGDSLLRVEPMSVVRIQTLRRVGDTIRTRFAMKEGNVDAVVEHTEGTQSDFAIVTPATTLSVRGTRVVQAGHFPGFGSKFGLTQRGRIQLVNQIRQVLDLIPKQQTNQNLQPPFKVLAFQYLSQAVDPYGFSPQETYATGRRLIQAQQPPTGPGGGTPGPFLQNLRQDQTPIEPIEVDPGSGEGGFDDEGE